MRSGMEQAWTLCTDRGQWTMGDVDCHCEYNVHSVQPRASALPCTESSFHFTTLAMLAVAECVFSLFHTKIQDSVVRVPGCVKDIFCRNACITDI